MEAVATTQVESESIRDFALVMQQDDRIQPRAEAGASGVREVLATVAEN